MPAFRDSAIQQRKGANFLSGLDPRFLHTTEAIAELKKNEPVCLVSSFESGASAPLSSLATHRVKLSETSRLESMDNTNGKSILAQINKSQVGAGTRSPIKVNDLTAAYFEFQDLDSKATKISFECAKLPKPAWENSDFTLDDLIDALRGVAKVSVVNHQN